MYGSCTRNPIPNLASPDAPRTALGECHTNFRILPPELRDVSMSTEKLDLVFAIGGIILVMMIVALGLAAQWIAKRENVRAALQSRRASPKLNVQEGASTQAEAQLAYLQELVARAESMRQQ